jgi:hypothetical protein
MVAIVASWSFWTTGAGVPLGRKKPLQKYESKSTRPCSCALGRFGRIGERSRVKIAIAFIVLLSICVLPAAARAQK